MAGNNNAIPRFVFLFMGCGMLLYGIAQICVTGWQIVRTGFDVEVMTHPRILLMVGLHIAASVLGLLAIAWSYRFAPRAPSVASSVVAEGLPGDSEHQQQNDEPGDSD